MTPALRARLLEELGELARLVAGRPDLRLIAGPPGSGWHFQPFTATISMDGGRLETEPPDFSRGLVLHEAAHAALTRIERVVPLRFLQERPLRSLLNVVEDCRIETWMQTRFPGCAAWVREYNNRLLTPLLEGNPGRPPAAQFLNGLLARWWFGRIPANTPPAVRRALEAAEPAMESIVRALPRTLDHPGQALLDYARHPVSRCFTRLDAESAPDDQECAVRLAQHAMWTTVHQELRPIFLPLLPTGGDAHDSLRQYLLVLDQLSSPGNPPSPGRAVALPPRPAHHGFVRPPPDDGSALPPTGAEAYRQSRQQQHPAIERLAEAFLRWFQTRTRGRWQRGYPSGPRLDLRQAMQFEADRRRHNRLWCRTSQPVHVDPHFILILDRSGSMDGERILQSFHGVVLLCEVCRRVGLPLDIHVFANRTERLLHRDDPLTEATCARLGNLPGSAGGDTNLADALQAAAKDAADSPHAARFVLLLSDGQPDDASAAQRELTRLAGLDCHVLGLGLGPETRGLKDLVPHSRVELAAADIPSALGALIARCLLQSPA